MSVPDHYLKQLRKFGSDKVEFGFGGIELFRSANIIGRQVGYSVAPDGATLSSDEPGGWRSKWLVIGQDLCVGDPVFIDVDDSQLPVMTAVHGEGSWNPLVIAKSSEGFFAIMQDLVNVSFDRSSPDQLKARPITATERQRLLDRVREWNDGPDAEDFWLAQLGDDVPTN